MPSENDETVAPDGGLTSWYNVPATLRRYSRIAGQILTSRGYNVEDGLRPDGQPVRILPSRLDFGQPAVVLDWSDVKRNVVAMPRGWNRGTVRHLMPYATKRGNQRMLQPNVVLVWLKLMIAVARRLPTSDPRWHRFLATVGAPVNVTLDDMSIEFGALQWLYAPMFENKSDLVRLTLSDLRVVCVMLLLLCADVYGWTT